MWTVSCFDLGRKYRDSSHTSSSHCLYLIQISGPANQITYSCTEHGFIFIWKNSHQFAGVDAIFYPQMQVSCRFNYLILAAAQFIDYLFFHDSNQSVGRLKVHFNGIRPIEHLLKPFPYQFHHHILLSILSFNYLIFQCWMQSASFLLITVKLWWFDQL